MNDDLFNMEVRKFLKQLGVGAQREIEAAVRGALETGRIKGHERLIATARIDLPGVGLVHELKGEIRLE